MTHAPHAQGPLVTANLRVGSLASGCGALDLALQQVLPNTELAWVCENDRHASTVLAARFPGVPNLNDVTAIDHTAPPVDILIGGLPCQPYSVAGKQKGKADNRDLLPESIRLARLLEPRLIFLENVSNLVRKPEFRALAGGMAEIGYDIRWTTLRASDVGACHRRERLFAVAYPFGTRWKGREHQWLQQGRQDGLAAEGSLEHILPVGKLPAIPTLPTPTSSMTTGPGTSGRKGGMNLQTAVNLLPTPTAVQARNATATRKPDAKFQEGWTMYDVAYADRWGQYAAAINRHEDIFGIPAPEPVDDKNRLSPAFVEWMMCLPAGWVTDIGTSSPGFVGPVPPRTAQLKILGNAVVPPQAAEAYRRLLNATG